MTKYLLTLLCIAYTNMLFATDFITRWDMSNPGSNTTEITFGVGTTGTVNYTWETVPAGTNGSGTFTGTTAIITGLPANAIIRVHIDSANFNRININNGTDRQRLVDVEQWGSVAWNSMQTAFYGCNNLNISSTDIPDLTFVTSTNALFASCTILNGPLNIDNWNISNVNDISYLFSYCSNFNQPIGNWNTSNVTYMDGMFQNATSFNQAIGNWNTSNVTSMYYMFYSATNFNQPIGNWNTGNVKYMSYMFAGASSFNQPINNWNTGNVISMLVMFRDASSFNQAIGNWNTGNVTNMNGMFYNATSFNQDISNWNVSQVVMMNGMFYNATAFNSPLNNWDISNVNDISSMFKNANSFNQLIGKWKISNNLQVNELFNYSGMDCANYSKTLYMWSIQPNLPGNKTLGVQGLYYGTNIIPIKSFLTTQKFWTINGDFSSNNSCCILDSYTVTASACGSFLHNGHKIRVSGTYIDTFTTGMGCDSIITLHLTISYPNFSEVIKNGDTLTATNANALYQWVTCPGYIPIPSEYNQSFIAPWWGGSFAVIVNKNGCVDTSECYSIAPVGVNNQMKKTSFSIYPNPVSEKLYIQASVDFVNKKKEFYNSLGQLLFTTKRDIIDVSTYAKGIYYLKCEHQVVKVVVE